MGEVQNGKVKQLFAIYPLENMAVELRGVGLATACLTVILLVIAHGPLAAAGPGKKSERNKLTAAPEVVEAWQDMRFGMFNCWGPVSLTGLEIGWSRGAPRGGEFRVRKGQGPTPVEVYDNLYKKWNPDKFDARQWVQIAKDAGQKYMIFLVKHHDGFCLYDSKLTDYKITGAESAWKHDVMADVAKACHEAGLKLIIYYSQPDWHHPDYRTKNHHRYIKYLHGQVRELLTNYGKIDGFWFDLGGKPEDWDSENLFEMMRTLQPWLIINNRCGLPGDFITPEQNIGYFRTDRPWESCITLGTQWSWKPNDKIKSLKECVEIIVRCAGGNGNLALNTGPMPDGRIEPRQVQRFKEIGAWLKEYGQSIYATRGGPFKPCLWGTSTHKDNRIYVHVLSWQGESLLLPAIDKKVVSSTLLTGGKVNLKQTQDGITVTVPKQYHQDMDTVVILELDGPASEIAPVSLASGSLAHGKPARASNVYQNRSQYGPDKAFDDDNATCWAIDPETKQQHWLEVDLGEPCVIDLAVIKEPRGCVREFELQRKIDGEWQTFYSGTKLRHQDVLRFEPITAQQVRLNIPQLVRPDLAIWEFQLFGPNGVKEKSK